MLTFVIYLLGVVDSFKDFEFPIGFLLAIVITGALVTRGVSIFEDDTSVIKKTQRSSSALFVLMSALIAIQLFLVLLPDSKTLAAMYVVPKIVGNRVVQEIPTKVGKIFELKLDQWIKNLDNSTSLVANTITQEVSKVTAEVTSDMWADPDLVPHPGCNIGPKGTPGPAGPTDTADTKVCPKCGKLMIKIYKNEVLTSYPAQYPMSWWCKCGHTEDAGVERGITTDDINNARWNSVNGGK